MHSPQLSWPRNRRRGIVASRQPSWVRRLHIARPRRGAHATPTRTPARNALINAPSGVGKVPRAHGQITNLSVLGVAGVA